MAVSWAAGGLVSLVLASVAGSVFAEGTLYRWGDALPSAAAASSVAGPAAASSSSAQRAAQCALHQEQLQSYQSADSIQDMESQDQMRSYSPEERGELIEAAQKAIAATCASAS